MIIDFHTHCFAPAVAAKAMPRLAANCAASPCADGTPQGLLAAMAQSGIDRCVVANIATNPHQQQAVNAFAIGLQAYPQFIPFGSVHPEAPDALEELQRIKAAGLKGIKLHPDYQGFYADDPRVFPIYRQAARLGLITLFHAGVDIGMPEPVRCSPARLRAALPQFEGAAVVAAHFGGFLLWQEVMEQLCGQDVYFDTSYSARKLPPSWARQICGLHDSAKLLFGSDSPWAEPLDEINFVRQICGDEKTAAAVLGGNALRLLGDAPSFSEEKEAKRL